MPKSKHDHRGSVFNHDIRYCTNVNELQFLSGALKYSGRALGLTRPSDIIQLTPEIRDSWTWIQDHYRRIGLDCTAQVKWAVGYESFREHPGHDISVFFFGPEVHEVKPDENRLNVSTRMNSKNEFMEICRQTGTPIPPTNCFQRKSDLRNLDFNYPVYLKVSTSVSGLGVHYCPDSDSLARRLAEIEQDMPFQVQEEIKNVISFLNVQYRSNLVLEKFITTEQVLKGFQHNGNRFPATFNAWHLTDPLAEIIHRSGMKGPFAFDLAFTAGGDAFVLECNPRFNGSSYPAIIAERLGIKSWIAKNFTTRRLLNDIRLGSLEYSPVRGTGVIVFNWGCTDEGKIGIMIAGDEPEQAYFEEELFRLLA